MDNVYDENNIIKPAETADAAEAAKTVHRSGVKELKEKISELDLEIEVLKTHLEIAKNETQSYIDIAQRTKAEFDNFKKRNSEQLGRLRDEGIAEGALKILPVYDALAKASEMINDENTLKGILMIAQRLAESFKELGIEKMESLGRDFDPALHNAVMNEETENEEIKGKVTEVFQEGFRMGDRILRYAMVRVAV